MKKLLVVFTALSCCFLAYSQEVDVRLIPRVDVNTYVPASNEGGWAVDFGNTSFYTLIEGSFLENFSYSVANHWISVYGWETPGQDIAGLYTSTLYSNAGNWLDWANLSYTLVTEKAGSFDFTLGKDVLSIGGFEYDAYDFDCHFGLCSMMWNYLPVYQWGGKVGYTTPSEMTSICFQAATSPYGGMLFRDRQYGAYSLYVSGEYDWYSSIWAVNFLQYAKSSYVNVITLGNQFYAGDCTIGIDWMNRARSVKSFFNQEMSLMGTVSYNFGDKVELFGKVGWDRFAGEALFSAVDDMFGIYEENAEELTDPVTGEPAGFAPLGRNYVYGGLGVHWYPLKDSQDLRVHAVVSANNWASEVSVNLGVTYNFSLTDLIKR